MIFSREGRIFGHEVFSNDTHSSILSLCRACVELSHGFLW